MASRKSTTKDEGPVNRLTVNRLVAANLRRAREAAGLTQKEAGQKLRDYLGHEWIPQVWSAAERSADTDQPIREFDADLLVALAAMFSKPVTWFLLPKEDTAEIWVGDSQKSAAGYAGIATGGSGWDPAMHDAMAGVVFNYVQRVMGRLSNKVRDALSETERFLDSDMLTSLLGTAGVKKMLDEEEESE